MPTPTPTRRSLLAPAPLAALTLAFWPQTACVAPRWRRAAAGSAGDAFVDILPGPRLAGWTRLPVPVGGPLHADVEVWRSDPARRVLSCFGHLPTDARPKPGSHEFLRYDEELGDFVFRAEWRYVDASRPGWNSGLYARNSADGRIWHQAQMPGKGKVYLFGDSPDAMGALLRGRHEAPAAKVNPPGEWNRYELTARGERLALAVNGEDVCAWEGLRVRRGHIGLEAEHHHVEFRELRLRRG